MPNFVFAPAARAFATALAPIEVDGKHLARPGLSAIRTACPGVMLRQLGAAALARLGLAYAPSEPHSFGASETV
jgi:hypothetical protein